MEGSRTRRTWRNLLVRVQLLKQTDGVIHHVRLLRELILCGVNLFDGEEFRLGKVCKEREDEVAVAVWDDRLREIVFRHF